MKRDNQEEITTAAIEEMSFILLSDFQNPFSILFLLSNRKSKVFNKFNFY